MNIGVNIDHIAVLREARAVNDPCIIYAMFEAISGGADSITIHLREDRRHINDQDLFDIVSLSTVPVNLECSINPDILQKACEIKPSKATIVPENRQELTTEGGLDLSILQIKDSISKLQNSGVEVSLFIDPNLRDVELAKKLGADSIELHTGAYANTFLMLNSNLKHTKYSIGSLKLTRNELEKVLNLELKKIKDSIKFATEIGLKIAAGHGLNYQNVKNISSLNGIFELNIGQSIIAKSVFVGLREAVRLMKDIVQK